MAIVTSMVHSLTMRRQFVTLRAEALLGFIVTSLGELRVYLGKRAWLPVTSGDIGSQSPRARDPMSPLVTGNHAFFPL